MPGDCTDHWVAELGRIAGPVQVVAGREDLGAKVAMVQYIVNGIRGALLGVLDAAHLSARERREGFGSAFQALLAQLG